jgi:hypothetical protein
MKHPNEYWLRYMLMFSGATLEQIVSSAELYEMVPPSIEELQALRDKLDETKPSPFRMDTEATRGWVRRQRIMSLASEDPSATAARDLLGDNRARPVLEALLIADTPLEEIPGYVQQLSGTAPTKRTVNLFRHYFWNRDALSTQQWYDYLEVHANGEMLRSCFNRGKEYALWRLGCRIEVPQEDVLKGVFHESAMRFFETAERPNTRDTAMTAKMWAENIFKATEELNKTGDAVKQVLDGLKDIAIKLGKREISSLEDLPTGGEDV